MDNAVEEYLAQVPETDPELDWEFKEVGEFGSGNWTISYRHKAVDNDA